MCSLAYYLGHWPSWDWEAASSDFRDLRSSRTRGSEKIFSFPWYYYINIIIIIILFARVLKWYPLGVSSVIIYFHPQKIFVSVNPLKSRKQRMNEPEISFGLILKSIIHSSIFIHPFSFSFSFGLVSLSLSLSLWVTESQSLRVSVLVSFIHSFIQSIHSFIYSLWAQKTFLARMVVALS